MPLLSSDGGDDRGGPHLFDKTGGSPVLEQKWTVAPEIQNLPKQNLPKPIIKSKKRPMPEEEDNQIVDRIESPKRRGGRKQLGLIEPNQSFEMIRGQKVYKPKSLQ